MKTKFPPHKGESGLEIAINPSDLLIVGDCRILEKPSTAGFDEVPEIHPPNSYSLTNRMIQDDQNWSVEFIWKVYGPLACLLENGYWKCQLFFELMGGGETHFNPEAVVQDQGISNHKYNCQIEIPRGSLKPGVYRVVCCLQYYFKNGNPGPINGFDNKGLIKIYKDKKIEPKQFNGDNLFIPKQGSFEASI